MTETKPTKDAILAALEAALQAEQLVDWVHDLAGAQGPKHIHAPDNSGLAHIEDACTRAVAIESDRRGHLIELITELVGSPPWTVLIAGHLIVLCERADCLSVVPIEKVHYLDDLRRFP